MCAQTGRAGDVPSWTSKLQAPPGQRLCCLKSHLQRPWLVLLPWATLQTLLCLCLMVLLLLLLLLLLGPVQLCLVVQAVLLLMLPHLDILVLLLSLKAVQLCLVTKRLLLQLCLAAEPLLLQLGLVAKPLLLQLCPVMHHCLMVPLCQLVPAVPLLVERWAS